MCSIAKTTPVVLDNHLGWHGWQLDLPMEWNPARLSGDEKSGTVILADLERVRMEMRWRRVRSRARVDLSRVAQSRHVGKAARASLTWTPLPHGSTSQGIREGQQAKVEGGAVLGLLLSEASDRLLFVRISGTPEGTADPWADRILGSIGDASGAPCVPWCVYGFAWAVPAGLRLTHYRFTAGRASVTFRHRRQSLTFERWVLAGAGARTTGRVSEPSEPTSLSQATGGRNVTHHGHSILLTPLDRCKLWHRITRGQVWRADWTCPASNRGYRVETAGPDAADLLETAIRSIPCHRESERSTRCER